MEYLSFADIAVGLVLFIFFYIIARSIQIKRIEQEPYYRFFITGLMAKLIGGILVCLVYVYYYGGGDTLNYYHDNTCVVKLFLIDPGAALKYSFVKMDTELWNRFTNDTDWPWFGYDKHSAYVSKVTWFLALITFNSFIGQTMLLSFISFFAIWRLYKMFVSEIPALEKELAFAILFIPSVIFWGSGLLKDTITLAAVSLFTSSFYQIIKTRRAYLLNSMIMIISSWLLIRIKPYIFFALLPGTIIWLASYLLEKQKNKIIRSAITPFLILMAILLSYLFLENFGSSLDEYALDKIMDKAIATQQDLKRDAYQGSSFDIGDFDPTFSGVINKMPVAIVAALFRPFLWESNNAGTMVSGIENFLMLLFTIYLLLRLKIINFFRLIFKNHLVLFSVSFSLFFAFSVGLTTSNFGSLVRYKIPAIPFFVASLLMTNHFYKERKKEKEMELVPGAV